MIGTILVHDGEALDPLRRRTALGDVDHPGIEITVLSRDALVDRVRDDMRDAPPVLRGRGVGKARELLARDHVPKPELDLEPAVRLRLHSTSHQHLCVDEPPVAEARLRLHVADLLDEGACIERLEKTRALEIGADDARDIATDLLVVGLSAHERGNRDRQRNDVRLAELEMNSSPRGDGGREQHRHAREQGAARNGCVARHSRSFGLKVMFMVFHCSYFSGGNLSGEQVGFRTARNALSAAAR